MPSLEHFLFLNNLVNDTELREQNLPCIYNHATEYDRMKKKKKKGAKKIINTVNDP